MPSTLQSPSSDPTSCQGHGTHHHLHHIATPRCRTSPSFTPHFHNHKISAVPTNPRPRPPLTHHHSIHDRRTRSFRSPKLFLLLLLRVLDFVNPSNQGRTHARTSINPPGIVADQTRYERHPRRKTCQSAIETDLQHHVKRRPVLFCLFHVPVRSQNLQRFEEPAEGTDSANLYRFRQTGLRLTLESGQGVACSAARAATGLALPGSTCNRLHGRTGNSLPAL
jgi:hypothetical protein